MVKIIDGIKYSTATAELVGKYCNGYLDDNFNYCCEELYRKKNGEFFLFGVGGPNTCYATSYGTDRGFGAEIIPYTDDDAKEWAEQYLSGEEYEEIFGLVEE